MVTLEPLVFDVAKRKPPTPPPEDPQQPTSETVRVAVDLMEAMREICFHTKDSRGKRKKLAQWVDDHLRPVVFRELEAVRQRVQAEQKSKGD